MKFGTGSDPVNALSLRVALSRTLPADPARERVKVHKFQDGSVSLFDFGVREQLTAAFSVELLTKADFVTLVDYLSANEGARVKVVEEWENERLFGPGVPAGSTGPSTYYVRILEHGQYSEAEWSATRGLFSVNIKVLFAGVASDGSDEKAPAGSALLNALVRVDTVCADYIQAGDPGAVADGSRWLRTSDRALLHRVSGGWGFLYTVAADDVAYRLKNGVFYWSAFCDEPTDLVAGVVEDHLAGWITAGSIDFGQENIDIGKGPAIARKEGFSFSVANSARFHDYLEQNRINFSGARAFLSILRDTGGARFVQQMRAGRVNTGKISLTSYTVECEPEVLDGAGVYPVAVISLDDPRYADVMAGAVGKPVFVTFGEFGKAQLQNVSSDRQKMIVAREDGVSVETFSAAIDRSYTSGSKHLRILLNRTSTAAYRFTFTAEQLALLNSGKWCVQVLSDNDSGSSNAGSVRRVSSIDGDLAGWWSVYMDDELPTLPPAGGASPPDTLSRIFISLLKISYAFQTGEAVSGGFGKVNSDGTWSDEIHLYSLDENQKALVEIPAADFTINTDGNLVTLNPKVAVDSGKILTYSEKVGENVNPLDFTVSPLSDALTLADTKDFGEDDFPLDDFFSHTALWQKVPTSGAGTGRDWTPWLYSAMRQHVSAHQFWSSVWTDPVSLRPWLGGQSFRATIGIDRRAYYPTLPALNNSLVVAWQYKALQQEGNILAGLDNLRLAVSFDISSTWELFGRYGTTSVPIGFILMMRIRKTDGGYVENAAWKISVGADEIGAGDSSGYFRIKVDNMPGNAPGRTNGFTSTPPSLTDIFPVTIYDSVPNTASLPSSATPGQLVWVENKGQMYARKDAAVSDYDVAAIQPAVGDPVWEYRKISAGIITQRWYKVEQDVTILPGEKKLVAATAWTDYIPWQSKAGRDLFNLSDDLAAIGTWSDVDAFEFVLAPQGISDVEWIDVDDWWGAQRYNLGITLRSPRLFSSSEISVKDRPIFSDVRGEFLSGSYPTPAEDVSRAILDACYPGAYSVPALDALFALPSRAGWIFRKQFTAQKKADAVLEELLKNLWAVATISDDDLLEIQSLAPDDHGRVSLVLTDSNILEDSPGEIEQREADSMFQRFEMSFDYYPPSAASAALQKWNRVQISSPTDGTNEEKTALTRSAAIWNRDAENVKREEFEYHYASGPLPLNTWAVKWHSLNSWLVEVTVPIDHALGSDGLRLMSRVSVRCYYLSASQDLDAFVVRRRPDIYSATCRIGLYIWAPPGYLGGFLDYYNDALGIETRDLSLWTDANGKKNDAGQIETRGTLAEKDAGQIETRAF